jgi:putative flippase GtrA
MMAALSTVTAARFYRFAAVGALGTLVYYIVLWSLVEVAGVPVMISTSIAFLIVVVENYLLHYWWTFRSAAPHATAFRRFLLMSSVGFWLNWSIMFLGVQRLGFAYLWIQAIAIAVVVAWNFLLSTLWIFFHTHHLKQAQSAREQEDNAN